MDLYTDAAPFVAAELSFVQCGERGAWLRSLIRHATAALSVIEGPTVAGAYVRDLADTVTTKED